MAKPPQAVRDKVIAALYKEFDSLQWEQLATREKSEAYERFLTSPDVGGALDPYMDPGAIRVWIKDGPAKEYGRALEDVGAYAKHTSRVYPEPQDAIKKILGNEWSVTPDSVTDKPMRCEARTEDGETQFVLWGPFAALKELIWHALLHQVKGPTASLLIVVTRPTIAPLQTAQRKQAEAMCQLIGAEFKSIMRVAVTKASAGT
jgi:hypothetical protein